MPDFIRYILRLFVLTGGSILLVYIYLFYDVHANNYKVEAEVLKIERTHKDYKATVKFMSPIDNKEHKMRIGFGLSSEDLPQVGEKHIYLASKDTCEFFGQNKTRKPDLTKPISHCTLEHLPW